VSQPIRVLLIEDNRVEACLTQKWLEIANGDSFAVEWVEHMAQGLDRLTRAGIDVVLSDLNLPDSRGLETFITLHAQAPEVPIVVLTGQDDETLGALAVETGAQDYLVKQQMDGARLARVLRYTLARHRAQGGQLNKSPSGKSPRVIGFLGAKGGVGTTTVALNVATALAKQRKSVILAEIRPSFGTLAYHLRQEPRESLRTLLDQCPEGIGEQDVAARLCKGPAESRVLFGPQQMDAFQEIDPDQAESVVKVLAKMAEFIILDFPSQPSTATQAAIGQCHFVAVVSERELGSVLCGKVALNQLQSWGVGGDSTWAVVVNRNEYPSPMDLTEIRSHLGCGIVGVVPLATSASFETAISRAERVAASFAEIGNRFAADKIVSMKL